MTKSQNKTRITAPLVNEKVEALRERFNDLNIRLNKVEVEMGMWGGKKVIPIEEIKLFHKECCSPDE